MQYVSIREEDGKKFIMFEVVRDLETYFDVIVNPDNAVWVSIKADSSILRLIVEKGSIAIDGISLTVAYVDKERFKVSVIPHTGEETTLLKKKRGAVVNLENDIIGKYVERLLFTGGSVNGRQPDRTENLEKNKSFAELLSGNGFI